MNAKPPPEQPGAGEHHQCHPLEAEIEALMQRVDPVPEEVVNAARRAFDRRERSEAEQSASKEPADRDAEDAPADFSNGDAN